MICGDENDTNGFHFAGFSKDVAFARHFMATQPSPTCGSATGIGYACKKLSKMAGNSASYSPNSWIDYSYRIVANFMQASASLPEL